MGFCDVVADSLDLDLDAFDLVGGALKGKGALSFEEFAAALPGRDVGGGQ